MLEVNVLIAFIGGVISFFAPCVVPLLPTYVAYIFGVAGRTPASAGKVLEASIFYLIGFSLVFVFLGAFAGTIGGFLRSFDFWFIRIGGVILVLFGLQTLGVFHLSLPTIGRMGVPVFIKHVTGLRSLFLGIVFSLVWTPCVGALLGSILILAASTERALYGALLLFIYSLGISLPFLIIAFLILRSSKFLTNLKSIMPIIIKASGIILIAIGLLLLTDTFKYVNSWIFDLAFRLGYSIR